MFLRSVSANYSDVWRNFGVMWVFIVFNIIAACALYWWVRVPRAQKTRHLKAVDHDQSITSQDEDSSQNLKH